MPWMINAAASVGGALIGSSASKSAAKEQARATEAATGEQRRQFDTTRSDQAPSRAAGSSALAKLMGMLGFSGSAAIDENDQRFQEIRDRLIADEDAAHQARYGMSIFDARSGLSAAGERARFDERINAGAKNAFLGQYGDPTQTSPDSGALSRKFSVDDFWEDPVTKLGYQSGLDLGTKALRNAAPLTTGLDSGAALKELTKFGTDYAGSKAGESYSRFEGDKSNVFNRLMAMVGGGQVANQVTANAGTNMATNVGNLLTSNANAQGASRIAGANAWSGALSNISNWWNQNQTLDRLDEMRGSFRTPPYKPVFQGSFDSNIG